SCSASVWLARHLHLSVIRFVKERADFVSLRRQQRRRTIPSQPNPVNTRQRRKPDKIDKSLILKDHKMQKRLAAANLFAVHAV
ncbi:hypothetical protein ACFPAG_14880, partial [Vogesella sp. GCM10023246]